MSRARHLGFIEEFDEAEATTLIRAVTTLEVWDRGDEGLRLVESRPDIDVIIDPNDGRRWFSDDPGFAEVADGLETVEVSITCHTLQEQALLSPAKVVGLMGGSRAGKTQTLAWWLFRQWLLRGNGDGDRDSPGLYWWVAPTLEKAYRIGCKKIAQVWPKRLRGALPRSERAADLSISLFDGARIEFHHAHAEGDNLKGEAPEAIALDEAASVKKIANWRILLDRTIDRRSQIAAATTPVGGHWIQSEIIRRARTTPEVTYVEVSQFDNPWAPEEEIWRGLEASGALSQAQIEEIRELPDSTLRREAAREKIEDPFVLRERFGVWASDGLALYSSYDAERHVVATTPDMDWVTEAAVGARFHGHKGYAGHVGGQDFNVNPMTTVVCRVFTHPETGKWGLFVEDEVQTVGTIEHHCPRLKKRYAEMAIACDATGCFSRTNAAHTRHAATTTAKIMREAGFDARPPQMIRGKPRNPTVVDRVNLVNRLFYQGRLLVHKRCSDLREGLEGMVWASDGTPLKETGTKTDRLSSAPDALGYLVWRLFRREWTQRAIEWAA